MDKPDGEDTELSGARQITLVSLYGRGKGLWDEYGGVDAWLRHERENFYGEKGEPQWTLPSLEELKERIAQLRGLGSKEKRSTDVE